MAIVTSSEPGPFARTHARTGLLPHFELVLTRVDYTNAKPDPEPYLCAVARLGVPPARCLVIEDSERGLRAAKAAGLCLLGVPSGLTAAGDFARRRRRAARSRRGRRAAARRQPLALRIGLPDRSRSGRPANGAAP